MKTLKIDAKTGKEEYVEEEQLPDIGTSELGGRDILAEFDQLVEELEEKNVIEPKE